MAVFTCERLESDRFLSQKTCYRKYLLRVCTCFSIGGISASFPLSYLHHLYCTYTVDIKITFVQSLLKAEQFQTNISAAICAEREERTCTGSRLRVEQLSDYKKHYMSKRTTTCNWLAAENPDAERCACLSM